MSLETLVLCLFVCLLKLPYFWMELSFFTSDFSFYFKIIMSILNVSEDNSMLAFANFSIFDAVFENYVSKIYVENSSMSLTKKPLFAQTSTSLKLSLLRSLRKKCPYLEFF